MEYKWQARTSNSANITQRHKDKCYPTRMMRHGDKYIHNIELVRDTHYL
jgi:hypothetical protein